MISTMTSPSRKSWYKEVSTLQELSGKNYSADTPVVLDIETEGLYGRILAVQLYCPEVLGQEVFYKVLPDPTELFHLINEFKAIVGHSVSYDTDTILKYADIDPHKDFYTVQTHDTFYLSRIFSPKSERFSLDALYREKFGDDPYKKFGIEKKKLQKHFGEEFDLFGLAREEIIYMCLDCICTYKLFMHYRKTFKGCLNKFCYKLKTGTIQVFSSMSKNGLPLNLEKIQSKLAFLENKLKEKEGFVFDDTGTVLNVNSPKDMEKLYPRIEKCNKEALYELRASGDTNAIKIIQRRSYLREQTYFKTLESSCLEDGRVRGFFRASNDGGRSKSTKENLQNFSQDMKEVVEAPKGKVLIYSDYSQLELRCLAMDKNVKDMTESYRNNLDLHTETAKLIFSEKPTEEERYIAKQCNFSMNYGASATGTLNVIKGYGVDTEGISEEYLSDIRKKWLLSRPELAEWFNSTGNLDLNTPQYTPFGFPYIPRRFTVALNLRIQGMGAEVTQLALFYLHKEVVKRKQNVKIINYVHDSFLLECDEGLQDEWAEIIMRICQHCWRVMLEKKYPKSFIPIPVEVKVGMNWGDIERNRNIIKTYKKEAA